MVSGQWHDESGEEGWWKGGTGKYRNRSKQNRTLCSLWTLPSWALLWGSVPSVLPAIRWGAHQWHTSLTAFLILVGHPWLIPQILWQVCAWGSASSWCWWLTGGPIIMIKSPHAIFLAGEQLWSGGTSRPPELANFQFYFLLYFYFYCVARSWTSGYLLLRYTHSTFIF